MKKIYLFIIGLVAFFPLSIQAATLGASLDCPDSANAGAVISCKVYATPTGDSLAGVSANYDITGATFSSFAVASGWSLQSNSNKGFVITTATGVTSKTLVGTLKVQMPNSGVATITLKNFSGCNASDVDFPNQTTASKTIRVKSGVNTLETLSLTGSTFNFDKNTTTYNVTVDAESTTISATKTDSYAGVSGTGKKNLSYGKNTFKVVVTAENGIKKTYTINVTRPDNRSTNNNLSSLKLSNGTISFNKNTTTYNVEVQGTITNVKIDATLEDTKSSFVKNYGPRTVKLNYGKNTVLVKVKAENTKEKTYTLNITRKDDRSNNSNLSSITLSSGTVDFNKDTVAYQIAVANEVESINISATPEDAKAKVEFKENISLKEGANVTEIKVTAENGTTKSYKLTIIRSLKDQTLDTNNYLSSLTVKGYTLSFNKDVLSYNLTIKDEQQLEITATAESNKGLVTITGNDDLKNESKIIIKVTAEDGSVREYTLNITKPVIEEKEDSINMSYIAIGVFALGVISFIGAVAYKNKKNKK